MLVPVPIIPLPDVLLPVFPTRCRHSAVAYFAFAYCATVWCAFAYFALPCVQAAFKRPLDASGATAQAWDWQSVKPEDKTLVNQVQCQLAASTTSRTAPERFASGHRESAVACTTPCRYHA